MKTLYKRILNITALCLFSMIIKAQQPLTYNLYTLNPFLLNPAYAGQNNCLQAFLNNHRQWTNLENAPASYTFGVHGRIKSTASSLGLMVVSDNRSFVNYTTVNGIYAHTIQFNEKNTLYLGLSVGFASNKLNTDKLQIKDAGDPQLQNFNNNRFDGGFGALHTFKTWKLGVSIPHFFDPSGKFSGQYNMTLSNDYKIANNVWKLTPIVTARNYQTVGMVYDAHLMATWTEKISVQAGFRTDKSVVAGFGLNWNNFQLAYAYQFNTGTLYNAFSPSGTQEIQLAYKMCRSDKSASVVKETPTVAAPPAVKEVVVPAPPVVVEIPKPPVDPNAEKVKVELNYKDEKYNKQVEGNYEISKDDKVEYSGTLNREGTTVLYLDPAKYKMKITANGYLPVMEDLDLTSKQKGSEFKSQSAAKKIEKGLEFKYKSVNFETGSEKLLTSSYEALNNIATILKENPDMVMEVAGHTDNVGDDNKNLILSETRAKSVATYLQSQGVAKKQLIVKGYGETKPIADNKTEAGRLMNRRVQFTVK